MWLTFFTSKRFGALLSPDAVVVLFSGLSTSIAARCCCCSRIDVRGAEQRGGRECIRARVQHSGLTGQTDRAARTAITRAALLDSTRIGRQSNRALSTADDFANCARAYPLRAPSQVRHHRARRSPEALISIPLSLCSTILLLREASLFLVLQLHSHHVVRKAAKLLQFRSHRTRCVRLRCSWMSSSPG